MPVPPIDRAQADRYLSLLGKPRAEARLRAFPHRDNPQRSEIKARKGPFDLSAADQWQQSGRGLYIVVNDGGDNDAQITACRALFLEWDDRPIPWQLTAWQTYGLGEPTFIVTTGGKSAHLYWVLQQPIPPDQWIPLQAALIALTGADPTNRNPSRVLRLPGASYIGPDGDALGQTTIVSASGILYTPEQIAEWVEPDEWSDTPSPPPATGAPAGGGTADQQPIYLDDTTTGGTTGTTGTSLPPRPPETLREALSQLPPFQHDAGQYDLLLGLALRLHVDLGAADAQQLLAETCCQSITDLAAYFQGTPTRISPGSTWPYLRDRFGIDISRRDLRGHSPSAGGSGGAGGGGGSNGSGGAGGSGGSGGGGAPGPAEPTPPDLLTLAQVRSQLEQAIADGASRSDLEALRIQLATDSDLNPATLRDLLRSLQQEHDANLGIQREIIAIQDAAERRDIGSNIRLSNILPHSLSLALSIRTRSLPADDVASLVTYIIGISGLIKLGSAVIASESANYQVPINLYGALVARSGAKKSPLLKLLVELPSEPLRIELAREHTRQLEQWTDDNRGVKPSERPDPPQAAYLSISDTTSEALARQLQTQESRGLGLLIHRDELAGMFGNLNAYRSGRGGDEEQLLEAYDGSGFRSLRVAATGGGRFYSRCHLSIYGTIQPAVLQALVADGDASGLWARFCFVPLPERVVPLAESETELEQQESAWAAQHLAAVARYIYALPRQTMALDAPARRRFVAYEAWCQQEVLRASLPAQGALWGKAGGKVLRVAGLLHLLHLACEDGNRSTLISDRTMDSAITLISHLNSWTLSLHQQAADGGTTELMRLIHTIAEATGALIGWREIQQRLSRGQRREIDSATATAAMEALERLGVGEVERGGRGAGRYRSTAPLQGM